jgi:fructose-bisphosphate aldolase class II
MPLTTTRELIDAAYASGTGVGAFNAATLEQAEAIVDGAQGAGAGAIVQISHNAVRFRRGALRPLAAACAALAEAATVPIALHLDHVEDMDLLRDAGTAGMSGVMFDAAELEYDDNVAATTAAAEAAHAQGLWFEAELGAVGGKDGDHAVGVATDPGAARAFAAATGCDGLAVAVGTSHAMVNRTALLDLDRIAQLRDAVGVPLVLHGSSGVPDADLRRAVQAGITKVNVGTRLNVALTAAVRATLAHGPDLVDCRRYLGPGRTAMTHAVVEALRAITMR